MSDGTTGLDRIARAFAAARTSGRPALMPFITGGYPDLATTARLISELPAAGADLIEIGFPFSDPIADGPVIAESMHRALCSGVTPDAIFTMVRTAKPSIPLVAMVSISIVDRIGASKFIAAAVEAGFAGFIVPDADPRAAESIAAMAREHGAGFSALIAPTTSGARLKTLAGLSQGFVYLLARAGVTGERSDAPDIALRAAEVRGISSAPIAVGFGITTAEHVAAVGADADGAIVGSAIVRRMTDAMQRNESAADAALSLVRSLTGTRTSSSRSSQ